MSRVCVSLVHASLCIVPLYIGLAAGCDGNTTTIDPPAIAEHCNPLGGTTCLMPWPSAAYMTEADTVTGYRLDLPAQAMPVNLDGLAIDPGPYNRFDGFSPSAAMVAAFPTGMSAEGLPPHSNPAASLATDSPTIVLDMDTGKRLLHFAEVDMNSLYPEERTLLIRPLERMAPASRYVVAIRKTVKDGSGQDLPVPPAFEALRTGQAFDHPLMARLAPRYDAIFAALEAQGVSRDELVLAWDFVTASDEFLTGDLLTMRDAALPVMAQGLTFTAQEVAADPQIIYRSLVGTHQSPNFLSNGEEDDSVLVRDASGAPRLEGTFDANFAALIPACVTSPETTLPIPVIVFGHGLFGSASNYLDDSLLQQVANQFCFVIVAGDFIGLTQRQVAMVAQAAYDMNLASTIGDKLAQAIINFIALEHLVRGSFAEDPLFTYQDQPIIDTTRVFYLGASLGGIMGNVFMAYDPYIQRGALGVPGGAWSLLFERSLAWGALQLVAKASYRDDVYAYQVLIALLSMQLEPFDPITTATHVIKAPLPNTPAKQILMYEAVGDSLVNNLSTEMTARTMGIDVVGPSLYVPHGMQESTGPLTSGLTIYDEHPEPLPPATNVPPEDDNGTHGGINERPAVLRQIQRFFYEGELVSTCLLDGAPVPCDCATGACD